MMSAIESNVMVNPINDSSNFKPLDAENRLQHSLSLEQAKHPSDEASHVSLSDTTKQMESLKELILTAPEVNKERVEFFKEELATGRYHILSEQIAAKMFADIEMA